MFDIGFSELLLIGVVALIVIGPERLPKVARTAGAMLGRLNRYASQVKQDIERDIKLEELRKMQDQMRDTAQKYEIMAEETGQEVRQEVGQVEKTIAAMSVTDAGLSQQAYTELKAEEAASSATAPAQPMPHQSSLDGDIQPDVMEVARTDQGQTTDKPAATDRHSA